MLNTKTNLSQPVRILEPDYPDLHRFSPLSSFPLTQGKTILCDVDNTILEYEDTYGCSAIRNNGGGFAEFNQSLDFANLPPCKHAEKVLPKLVNDFGYRIVLITACGIDFDVYSKRLDNLHNVFGGIFHSVHFLPLGADKSLVFKNYHTTIVVDDTPVHTDSAWKLGHTTFLIDRPHNQTVEHSTFAFVFRAFDWYDIYERLTSNG